ncbi:hypothetical protein BC826DRAFT_1069708, partial [Russula brevipes]
MLLNLALLTHRKALAPISVLPPEVLARIFHLVALPKPADRTAELQYRVYARVPPLAPGRWTTRRCGRRSRATRRAPHTDRVDPRDARARAERAAGHLLGTPNAETLACSPCTSRIHASSAFAAWSRATL